MHRIVFIFLPLYFLFISCEEKPAPLENEQRSVLVFTKTMGFRHSSIPIAKHAIKQLASENNFKIDTTENAGVFDENTLKKYSAVVFLHTTGNVLDGKQETAFKKYIQSGGAFVGIHAATDTEYDWEWYGNLVGGYFVNHPEIQDAQLNVIDRTHIATKHLPAQWNKKDEWYNFKNLNPDVKVLMMIDENSYTGGTMNNNHPMAWYHEFDGGRSFYTALGHTEESWTDTLFLQHVWGGIKYAIGE